MKRAIWVALIVAGCRPAASEAPSVVERFYSELRVSQVTGAPTAEQLTKLAPYLSDSLQKLLTGARQLHDSDAVRAPNEKPAFADGDLFSSLFEGPGSVKTEAGSVEGESHAVLARMTYDSTSWTDTVIVAPQSGRLVIQDIRYGGNWDFALKGTLTSQLSGSRATAK